jgi:serine O-acetyltransferase
MMPKWLFPIKLLLNILIVPLYAFFSIFLGISIPRGAQIGPGLRVYHYGTIVINPCAIIGKNFSIHHGCTIGVKSSCYDQVIVGDNVTMGAGAKVLGKITVGDNCFLAANAVVVKDITANAIVGGVPATIIKKL